MTGRCVGLLALALAVLWPTASRAERLWLLVGASETSASAIARKARPLAQKQPTGLVVQTQDCGEAKNVYAWVAGLADTADIAQAALPRARQLVPDAYIKRCDVRPDSLLALRVNAVDPSIADVPVHAVNWREEDRVSSVKPLADGRRLLITRYFQNDANDPLEGRRERVSLFDGAGKRVVLSEDCTDVGRVTLQRGKLALQCVREQAADELLHAVLAFDADGRKLGEVERCRNPQWPSQTAAENALTCEGESVDATGRLQLQRKRVALSR